MVPAVALGSHALFDGCFLIPGVASELRIERGGVTQQVLVHRFNRVQPPQFQHLESAGTDGTASADSGERREERWISLPNHGVLWLDLRGAHNSTRRITLARTLRTE
jgi:hypothetical protein